MALCDERRRHVLIAEHDVTEESLGEIAVPDRLVPVPVGVCRWGGGEIETAQERVLAERVGAKEGIDECTEFLTRGPEMKREVENAKLPDRREWRR